MLNVRPAPNNGFRYHSFQQRFRLRYRAACSMWCRSQFQATTDHLHQCRSRDDTTRVHDVATRPLSHLVRGCTPKSRFRVRGVL